MLRFGPDRERVKTAQVSFRLSRSADNGFWAASKSVSGDGHTPAVANQIFIIAHSGLDVCDGAHSGFVMKKDQGSYGRIGNARGIPLIAETR